MTIDEMKDLFVFREVCQKKTARPPKDYDVGVSVHKSGTDDDGKQRWAARFAFFNSARQMFGEYDYIVMSNIEKLAERIYFRPSREKIKASHKIMKGQYAELTLSEAAEKAYRLHYQKKHFPLCYDQECDLYYIDVKRAK